MSRVRFLVFGDFHSPGTPGERLGALHTTTPNCPVNVQREGVYASKNPYQPKKVPGRKNIAAHRFADRMFPRTVSFREDFLDLAGMLYIFGIPLLTFGADLILRRLMLPEDFNFENYCYGFDLSLTGITTGFAILPDLKNSTKIDGTVLAVSLFVAFMMLPITMFFHHKCIPMARSKNKWDRFFGKLLLLVAGNFFGVLGMAAVLLLMWTK